MKKALVLLLVIFTIFVTGCKKTEVSLYPVLKYDDRKAGYAFMDKQGEIQIDSRFDDVLLNFNGAYAIVLADKKVEIIDKTGSVVLDGIDSVYQIKEDQAIVKRGDKTELVDLTAKDVLMSSDYIEFGENGIYSYMVDGKWGYRDLSGEKNLAPQFDEAFPFGKNAAVATKENNSFIIDKEFNISDAPFTESYKINEDTILAKMDGKQILTDLNGQVINDNLVGDLTEVYGDLYSAFQRVDGVLVKKVFNKNGKPVSDENFSDVRLLGHGFFAGKLDGGFALFSKDAGRLTDYKYDYLNADSFDKKLDKKIGSITGVRENTAYSINKNGEEKYKVAENAEAIILDRDIFIVQNELNTRYISPEKKVLSVSPKVEYDGDFGFLTDIENGKNYPFVIHKSANDILNSSIKKAVDKITTEENTVFSKKISGDILYFTLKTERAEYSFMADINSGKEVEAGDLFKDPKVMDEIIEEKKAEENIKGDVKLVSFSYDDDFKFVLRSDKEYFITMDKAELDRYINVEGSFFKSLYKPVVNK